MKFERHIDPYKSLQIGMRSNPLTIVEAGYSEYDQSQDTWMYSYSPLGSEQLNQLFNFLEAAGDLKIKNIYSMIENMQFKVINEQKINEGSKLKNIKQLMGKFIRIEFEDRIFEIPVNLNLDD